MSVSKEYIQKVISVLLAEGKEAVLKQFNVPEETFKRYLRLAKQYGISTVDKGKLISQIIQNYNEAELEAIAKGGRIVPGYAKVPIISFEGERIRIGAITDTHIGSVDFHEERLYQAFDEFHKEKVDFIAHAGDVLEGMSNRPGHIYELTHLGYDNQKTYAIQCLSQWKDTPIYAISGNHDRWYIKSSGANALGDIDKELENFHFLGHDEGEISLKGKAVLRLWHGEDGSCFSSDTEILTKEHGFIPFDQLTKKMHVATMTKENHVFEWQRPTHITRQEYVGDIYNIKHRCLDLMVTPNHKMWVSHTKSILNRLTNLVYPQKSHHKLQDGWFAMTADDIYKKFRKQKFTLPKTVNGYMYIDTPKFMKIPRIESKNKGMDERMNHVGTIFTLDLARLIAWYVTEGHARKNVVTISQYETVNADNYKEILDLVSGLGVNFTASGKAISIHGKELSNYLISECGEYSRFKYLPEWIKEGDRVVMETVFRTMIKGDGWERGDSFGYRSLSKRLREDFGLIAMKLGYAVNYNGDTVYVSTVQINPSITKKPTKFHYDGMVYCCEVPNGLIYVRRNGKTIWTHNSYALSYRLQKILESLTGGQKPNAMLVGHVHKYVDIFERHVHCTSIGCLQSQTRWMRSKRIAAHPGFAIIDYWVNNQGICQKTICWKPFYS